MRNTYKSLGVMLLILGFSACSAVTTKKSIDRMSNSKICSQATLSGKWETRSKYKRYVEIAKSRGLSCGVKIKAGACPSRLSSCSNDIICTGARSKPYYGSAGSPFWSVHPVFKNYAFEARSRGLSCLGNY